MRSRSVALPPGHGGWGRLVEPEPIDLAAGLPPRSALVTMRPLVLRLHGALARR
jgi:hypothetical protein